MLILQILPWVRFPRSRAPNSNTCMRDSFLKKLIIYLFLVALVYYLIILSLLLAQAFCCCNTRGRSSLQHMGFSLCGFSYYGAQALSTQAQQLQWAALGPAGYSHCGTRTLEHGFRSCGTRAWLPSGMWNLPGPETKPTTPAFASRFLSTVPPKSERLFLRREISTGQWS